jgi:hypothetical protein
MEHFVQADQALVQSGEVVPKLRHDVVDRLIGSIEPHVARSQELHELLVETVDPLRAGSGESRTIGRELFLEAVDPLDEMADASLDGVDDRVQQPALVVVVMVERAEDPAA